MTSKNKPVFLSLYSESGRRISAGKLNRLTRELRAHLKASGIKSVKVIKRRQLPKGAKSVEVTAAVVGGVFLVLSTVGPKLLDIANDWLVRKKDDDLAVNMLAGDQIIQLSPAMSASERAKLMNGATVAVTESRPVGRKLALIVGNSDYDDPLLTKLTASAVDANELASVLRKSRVDRFDKVTVLSNKPALMVKKHIERFFKEKTTREDVTLLYFSGHGILGDGGELYLAAKDTMLDVLSSTAISSYFITRQMDRSSSQKQVLILDCCFSGAFPIGTGISTGTAFKGKGPGRVVLTASDATQYAWEGKQVLGDTRNSVFTHYLIDGLRTDNAREADGSITIDSLYKYVSARMAQETPRQRPSRSSNVELGEIVIVPRTTVPSSRQKPVSKGIAILFYILALVPILGIILYAAYRNKPFESDRKMARNLLILNLVVIGLVGCVLLYN
jgi:hypothetical protein